MRDVPLKEKHRIRRISLSRKMEKGKGPEYTVIANDDGEVTWDGRRNVKVEGTEEWVVSNRQFHRLQQEVRKSGIKGMAQKGNYGEAEIRLEIEFADGSSTAIEHPEVSRDIPVKVFVMENALDKILGTYKYIGRW